MVQHGGYIPFSVLGGDGLSSSIKKKTVKRGSSRKKNKFKTKSKSQLSTSTYAIGTILRKNNQLLLLTNQRKWKPVTFR